MNRLITGTGSIESSYKFSMGLMYYASPNPERDYRASLRYFHEAIVVGNREAYAYLARQYSAGPGVRKGLLFYERGAQHGDSTCLYQVAMYLPPNNKKTFVFLKRAAYAGHLDARHELGNCYRLGEGTREDSVQAVKEYKTGAEMGSVKSLYSYGYCLVHGGGMESSRTKSCSTSWFDVRAL